MSSPTNIEKPQTRVHHPFSPSKLQALEACPCYESHNNESAASLAGTRQHNAVDTATDDLALEDNEALAVAQCLAYADSIAAKYPGGTVLKEQYLPIDCERIVSGGKTFAGTTAGYQDFAVISADAAEAEIVDWKFGQHAVETAENNLQGIAYMLGLHKRFPTIRRCTVHFVLPHRDELDVFCFELTDEKVNEHHLRIRTVVARAIEARKASDPFKSANPTVAGCLFCANIGKCPAVAVLALKVGRKFAPIQIPESISPTVISDATDAGIGIKLADVVKTWAEAYRSRVTEKATTDREFIPEGYSLVPMSRRKVLDALKFLELGKRFAPLDKSPEFDKLIDVPITGVEEIIKLAAPRGQKEKTVTAFGEAAEAAGLVERGLPFAILKLSTRSSKQQPTK